MTADDRRYIVWMPGEPGWELPPATHGPAKDASHLALHELAVAIAATGRTAEVRGQFSFGELTRLAEAAGAIPELPTDRRAPAPNDVVIMPEGVLDPSHFGRLAMSQGRSILLLLAAPGLLGWPFVEDWEQKSATDLELDELARPEHFRAMDGLGFELWGSSPALVERIAAARVRGTWIGVGRPVPFPKPLPKRYDVLTLEHNRWADLAAQVASRLDPVVAHYAVPAVGNDTILRAFGEARIFVHPTQVDGDSRLNQEAQAMGAVPVVLKSNSGIGLDDEGGAVAVATLDEMPGAVMRLLSDPGRLKLLRERGMRAAQDLFGWSAYVDRVDEALSLEPEEAAAKPALAGIGRVLGERERLLLGRIHDLERDKAAVERERDELAVGFDEARAAIRTIQETRVWRLAGMFWRTRDRIRHPARYC